MARFRHYDYETPSEDAAAGFERHYGEDPWEETLDRRDARRDAHDESDEGRREFWKNRQDIPAPTSRGWRPF